MNSNYNLPAIAAWVAEKLPNGHQLHGRPANVQNVLDYESNHWIRSAIAESLLLDALAASRRLLILEPYEKSFSSGWTIHFRLNRTGIRTIDRETRLLALLSAVQAIVEGEANHECK